MAGRIFSVNTDRPTESIRSLRNHLFLQVRRAEVISRGKIGAVELQRALEHCDRLIEVAGPRVSQPQVEHGQLVVRAELQHALKLVRGQGELMQTIIVQPQEVM